MLKKNSKIFLTGHKGMIGSAILRKLKFHGYKNIILASKKKLDLRNQNQVQNFIKKIKPDVVILAAAKVGGIKSNNTYRADFIYDNLAIQNNVINSSFKNDVKDLIFLGSSCIYPKTSKIPIKENYLLSNFLEKTNEPYAIAKIAGIKLCESYNLQYGTNYKSLMPCNAYGINDNYDDDNSHFFPALLKKIVSAKMKDKKFIEIWGSGKPLRELIFSDDVADACIFFLKKKTKHNLINIGTGEEKSILEYAKLIMSHLNSNFNIIQKNKKLDGTYQKLLDSSLAQKYGWTPKIPIKKGIPLVIEDFLKKNFF